jgi:CheY-like chemotaxis protein
MRQPILFRKVDPVALVLCTGIDPSLLRTRKLILEKAGHTVVTASDQRDVVAACKNHEFNVAVIGQTVSTKSKRSISSLVRQNCPSAKILELYQANHGPALPAGEADAWLEVPTDVPQDLAAQVSKLATQN